MFVPIQQSEKKKMFDNDDSDFKREFPNIKTLSEILSLDLPPQEWLIKDFLPVGTTLLVGPPKIGKSYFVLYLMSRILEQDKGAFYYAGEDDARRLKLRLTQLGLENGEALFHPGRNAPLGTSPIATIRSILSQKNNVKAAFIDTMHHILPRLNKSRDYESYVHDLKPWSELAVSLNKSILMVHHTRKENNEAENNPYNSILGSQGIMASFDNIMIMKKSSDAKGTVLNVIGKDVEEKEYRLKKMYVGWEIEGLESEASLGNTQTKVFALIKSSPGLCRSRIKDKLTLDGSYLTKIIKKLLYKNLIEEVEDRFYPIK